MVLNEFIYDPNANDNSAVFNLVEGSFVFIAGSVAGTGGMDIKTPVSTIGVRGTTVSVNVTTTNGRTTVDVTLQRDPDGGLGSITLSDLDGNVIATITSPEDNWVITPTQGGEVEVEHRVPDNANDQTILNEAIRAFEAAQQRVEDGGEFVVNDDQSDDNVDDDGQDQGDEDGDGDEGDEDAGEQENDGDPPPPDGNEENGGEENSGDVAPVDETPAEPGDPDTAPSSGGFESDLSTDPGEIDGGSGTTSGDGFGSDGSTTPDLPPPPPPPTTPLTQTEAPPEESGTTEPIIQVQNSSPQITLPTPAPVDEDGSIDLSGFVITDEENGALTASLTAGSTIRIPSGTGVTFIQGSPDVDETNVIISGTAQQIQDALNMAVYSPSDNADDVGSLRIVIDDGSSEPVIVEYEIPITPQQDPPTALNDAVTVGENGAIVSGDVTLNDIDPDVTPVPDILSVESASLIIGGLPVALALGTPTILPSGGFFTLLSTGQYTFDPNGAYDSLAAGQSVTETIHHVINDGNGNTDTATLTVTGENDAPVVSAATSPAAVLEGNAGTPTIETFLLSDAFTASDVDAGETPTIDASSVVVVANGSSDTAVTAPFQMIGTGNATLIELDTQDYDFLRAGQSGVFDVTFDIVSGTDVVSRTITITVTGENDAALVSPATSPASVTEGDAGIVSVESFLLSSTFTGSDADLGETPTVDASSVVITASGFSDTALTTPFQIIGTGNSTRIDVDTQNYDFLGVEESGVFNVSFNVVSGGETFARTITITINGEGDTLNVSAATSPPAVPEGDTGTATVATFLLTDTFTASDPDVGQTPTIDEASVVFSVNGGSDTAIIAPLQVVGTGNATSIELDTQNYDFLGAGQFGIFDVTFNIESGGDVVTRTISITVTGENDAPSVSASDPAALDAGIQGIVSEQTIDLNSLLTASDIDQTDTSAIDLSSIVITDNAGTDTPGAAAILSVSGSSVVVDTGQFDFLPDGDVALFDVTFDVISGPDTVSQTITISVNGTDETPINVIEGTANAEQLFGTTGNDYIIGNGNADGGYEYLFGDDGDDVLVGSDQNEDFDGGDGNDVINTGDTTSNGADNTLGSNGNDRINFGGNYTGFQIVSYANLSAAVIVSLDAAAHTGTVDKGVNGTDTLVDILKPLEASLLPDGGGLYIMGTEFNDTL